MHASLNDKVISSTRHLAEYFDFPVLSPVIISYRYPLLTESPFARPRRYLFWDSVKHCLNRSYPTFIAHTGSCARPNTSGHLSFTLVYPVFASCYESLLVDGPSRHYLYNLCIGAWIHTPLCSLSASTHSSSAMLASRSREHVRHTKLSLQLQLQQRAVISGLQSFVYLQAPILARPSGCSHHISGRPGLIHHA